jgi:outer membrane protein
VQVNATQSLFNRQQSLQVAEAKERARGTAVATEGKREEVVYRVASLYQDAERAARTGALAARDRESMERVLQTIHAQVAEGRALPLDEKRAAYDAAHARQVAESLADDQTAAETALAIALGFPAEDRVRPAEEQRQAPAIPESETQAIQAALASNKELRQLESQIAAKRLDERSQKAARLPRADLVAQYGLFSTFNNYSSYFRTFQRDNAEIGMSFQAPLYAGSAVRAYVAQDEVEISKLKLQLSDTRNRVASDLQQAFREVGKAQTAAEVAQLDLEAAREQLSVTLSLLQEGRATLRQVEEARIVENDKWIAFYDAQYGVEKAKWNVLNLTGGLLASIEETRP